MRQVLYKIPWVEIPVFGYGVMLVVAMLVCTELAARRAVRNGGDRDTIGDLSLWLFLFGILGARIFFFLQYPDQLTHWYKFPAIWEGGLVIYGAVIGAFVTLLVFAKRRRIRPLWLMDVIAPSVALGIALGRLGCLFNGCCYGDYCDHAWSFRFPPASPPYVRMVERGHQSRLGFYVVPEDRRVLFVAPDSDAERQGLRVGDEVVAIDGRRVDNRRDLAEALLASGLDDPMNQAASSGNPFVSLGVTAPIEVTVLRDGEETTLSIGRPRSLPIHPTQVYSSITGFLLFLVLTALYPLRRRDGAVAAWCGMLYAIGRFLVEFLRYDEAPILLGMTISQSISVLVFLAGAGVWLAIRRGPVRYAAGFDSPVSVRGAA